MTAASVREQFAETMRAVGREDPRLVVLVGDISHGILSGFREAFPERYYNVGILEPTMISAAAGLARVGWVPVVHTIAPFIVERGFEQIKIDFAYHRLGGNFVTVGGAFDYSNLGVTHHCYDDFALFKGLPNAEIVAPGSTAEFDLLFRQFYRSGHVTLYRIPGVQHGVPLEASAIVAGRAMLIRPGSDLTIIAAGPQLRSAVEAAPGLTAAGWDPEILYVHTVRPLDVEAVRASLAKTGRALIIEEHMESGGLGDDVMRAVRDAPVRTASLAIPDQFVTEYGTYDQHCERLGLTAAGVIARVASVFGAAPTRAVRA
ncbi:MAG: hypothetical protein C4558_03140 [Dehalococcoidia bacterium]|nr:MAG: hypothetical protein C4558_03140 [Dehalococcoidia bacterium]